MKARSLWPSSGVAAFADDVGQALLSSQSLGTVFEAFLAWSKRSGLQLSFAKCILTLLGPTGSEGIAGRLARERPARD
eukprot:14762180-Alexandrium_andersonii.AAC.1